MELTRNSGCDSDSSEQLSNDTELFNAIRRKPKKDQKISEEDRLEEIKECLTNGANINAVDKNDKGNTVLHIAVKKCYEKIVSFILDWPGVDIKTGNTEGIIALDIAQELNNQNITQWLKNHNKRCVNDCKDASKSADNMQNKAVHQDNTNDQIEEQRRTCNQIDKKGNTPLLNAALKNNLDLGRSLIQSRVIDINYQNKNTKQSAIDIVWEDGNYDFMLMLLKEGAKFPQSFTLKALNEDITIPEELKHWINVREDLHTWIKNNELAKIQDFVPQRKVSEFFNSENHSPLETAAKYADVQIVATLINLQDSLDRIKLTEGQRALLNQVNEKGETLLLIAAKENKKENVNFFIKCGIDINHRNTDSKLAVDFAWKLRYYDIVLSLLEADSEFPNGFDLDSLNEESSQKTLKEFVEERDDLHELIKKDNLESIEAFCNTSSTAKFYLNSQNESALLTAIKNKKLNIYAFLQSIGAVFKNEYEKEWIEDLPQNDRDCLQETMLKYFPQNEKSHIFFLISKSKPRTKGTDKFTEKVQALYEKLDSIPEIRIILEVVQYADYLEIIFDFDNESIRDINPSASKTTKGTADYKVGRLYISNIEENKLLGTLAHELTHFAMYILYKNDCNPFDSANSNMQVFAEITAELKKYTKEQITETGGNIEDSPFEILATAFRYKEEQQQSEIIVRIPHILAQYNNEGREWLLNPSTDQSIRQLFDYYKNDKEGGLTYDCQKFIENSCFIKPHSIIETLNELEGEINNIKKYEINFKKPIDLVQFLKQKQQVWILKTESTLLSSISIYQSLINKNYSTRDSLFFKFNSYVEKCTEINKAFYSMVGKVLCIRYTSDSDQHKLSNVLTTLNELLNQKLDKKIIFIIKDIKIGEWDKHKILSDKKYDGGGEYYKFTLNNLTEPSQKDLLSQTVEFQGRKIRLNELIDSGNENAKQIINSETLIQLIKNKEIKIGRKPLGTSDLAGAYSTFSDYINQDILIEHLSDKSDNIIVLSGITQKNFSIDLDNKIKTKNNGKEIRIYEEWSENDFKALCHTKPEQEIVWINWKSNKFILRQFYNPNFLIPIDLKKTIIKCDINNQFKQDIVLSSCQNNDVFNKLETDEKKKMKDLLDKYLSKIPNILIIDEPNKEILTIYTDIQDSDTFKELIEFLKNNTKENIEEYNPQILFQQFIKDYYNKSIHWLKSEEISNIQYLIWYQSYGSLDVLCPHIEQDHTIAFQENEFFDQIKDTKAAMIIDEAGMGKSTILTTMSTKLLESYWVIRIQLKDHQHAIDQLPSCVDINAVLEFLKNTGSINTPLEQNLAGYTLSEYSRSLKPLLLVCDGFDEIGGHTEQGKKKTSALLKFLKESSISASILVTAREEVASILQEYLSIFDIKIIKLSSGPKQEELLRTYWQNSLKWQLSIADLNNVFRNGGPFTIYAKILLNTMNRVLMPQGNSVIGIPLMLRLLAEGFIDKFKHFIKKSDDDNYEEDFNDLSISTIYKYFIDTKYKIYFREKVGISTDLIYEAAIIKSAFTKQYWRLAFQELFPEQAKDFIRIETPFSTVTNNQLTCDNQALVPLIRVALTRSTQFTSIAFIHRTFAEYFVAELLDHWLSQAHGRHQKYPSTEEFLLTQILLSPTYKTIRLFLNTQLTKQHITSNALEFYGQKTTTLWSEAHKKFFSTSYQTALHVATQENNTHIIDLLLNIFSTHQEKFISFLTVRNKDQETALYIAVKNHNDDLIEKFLDSVQHYEPTIQQDLILATIFRKYEDKDNPNVKYLLEYISTKEYSVIRKILNNVANQWDLIDQFLQVTKAKNINAKQFEEHFTRIDDKNIKKYLMLSSDHKGNTVLHLTCKLGYYTIIKWLIKHGANVNAINGKGDSILHAASVLGDLKTIKILIKHGANINAVNSNGDSILHAAVKALPNRECIKWLVDHGADVNATNHNGNSALDLAIQYNRTVLAQFLITHTDINDNTTRTIDLLIDNYQWHLIQLIVEKGLDVNSKSAGQSILLKVAAQKDYEEDIIGNYTKYLGQWKLIKWLVERVENINNQDKDGNTILHFVASKGHLQLVKSFITKHNADVNAQNSNGDTVLHITTCKGQYKLVKWLVEHGADVNTLNHNGNAALDLAVAYGYWKIAKLLVGHCANIGAQVLYAASRARWLDFNFLESLIRDKKQCGQDIINDIIDTEGNTLLHKFAQNRHLVLLNFVLKRGADIEKRNDDGHTALDLITHYDNTYDDNTYDDNTYPVLWILMKMIKNIIMPPPKHVINAISYPKCK